MSASKALPIFRATSAKKRKKRAPALGVRLWIVKADASANALPQPG